MGYDAYIPSSFRSRFLKTITPCLSSKWNNAWESALYIIEMGIDATEMAEMKVTDMGVRSRCDGDMSMRGEAFPHF